MMDPDQAPGAGPRGRDSAAWLAGLLVVLGTYYWVTQWRTFTHWSDPTIYLAGARSLAEGHGYRFSAHVGEAPIGLYPPLQSIWMSLFWRMQPQFPDNVPLLNGSMILLALGTMALSFVYLRRRGVPAKVAAAGLLVWGLSAKWSQFLYWLSSDIGFAGLVMATALVWFRHGPEGGRGGANAAVTGDEGGRAAGWDAASWWLTGLGLAVAYWWRSAALGLIAGALLVAFWQLVRHRRPGPLFAVGIPTAAAVLGWKLLAGAGRGYFSIWKVFIDDLGGIGGYFRNLLHNLLSIAFGRVFWDMICGTVVSKCEWLARKHWSLGVAGAVTPVVVFWLVAWMIGRGYSLRATRFDRAALAAMAVYVTQVVVVPFDAVHFHRYLYLLLPFMGVWLWWGWESLGKSSWVRHWANRVAWPAVFALCFVNAGRARSDRAYFEKLTPADELREVADWFRTNTPPQARLAMDFRLPTEHVFAWTGRPIIVDYYHPTYLTSPVTYESQGKPKADYVLSAARGQDVYPPPPGLPVAFVSSRKSFQLLRVEDPTQRQR